MWRAAPAPSPAARPSAWWGAPAVPRCPDPSAGHLPGRDDLRRYRRSLLTGLDADAVLREAVQTGQPGAYGPRSHLWPFDVEGPQRLGCVPTESPGHVGRPHDVGVPGCVVGTPQRELMAPMITRLIRALLPQRFTRGTIDGSRGPAPGMSGGGQTRPGVTGVTDVKEVQCDVTSSAEGR